MKFQQRQPDGRTSARQSGSALIYILIAIALLAALTVSLMEPANQQAQTQNTTNLVTTIDSQVSFITSALQECALSHPNEDAKVKQTPSPASTATQVNSPYPLNPMDPFYTSASATPGVALTDQVSEIRCPGNPGGNDTTTQNHAKIFGGGSGKFLPPPPALFGNWRYYNGEDGIFIMIASDKSDAYIQAALTRLDGMYAHCEADVINRLGTTAIAVAGDTVPGDSGAKECPANSICFRHWFKQNASASDQISAGCP